MMALPIDGLVKQPMAWIRKDHPMIPYDLLIDAPPNTVGQNLLILS